MADRPESNMRASVNAEETPSIAFYCRPSNRVFLRGIFLLLGVGVLIPWNAFISAKTYFESRVCLGDGSLPPGINLSRISSIFALMYNSASVITLMVVMAIQSFRDQSTTKCETSASLGLTTDLPYPITAMEIDPLNAAASRDAPDSEHRNIFAKSAAFWQVTLPLSMYIVVFWCQTLLTCFTTIPNFLTWTLLGLIVCGMSNGIAGAGIVASAGTFEPGLAMNPFLTGQSIGGVLVSVANFVAACGEDDTDYRTMHCGAHRSVMLNNAVSKSCVPYKKMEWSMFFYFGVGSVVIVACLLGFSWIDHFRETPRDYEAVESQNEPTVACTSGIVEHGLISEGTTTLVAMECEQDIDVSQHQISSAYSSDEPSGMFRNTDPSCSETSLVWQQVQGPAICIFITFFVSLSLFPGWTSTLYSVHQCKSRYRIVNDLYVPFGFVLFNVGDLSGRLLFAQFSLQYIQNVSGKLVVASFLRLLFCPLLYLCNGGSSLHPFHVNSDMYSFTVQFAFALSNGFLLSAAFAFAPSQVSDKLAAQERMSKILSIAVSTGLLCGSLFSFPLLRALDG